MPPAAPPSSAYRPKGAILTWANPPSSSPGSSPQTDGRRAAATRPTCWTAIRQRRPPDPRIRAPDRGAGRHAPRRRRDERHGRDHARADGAGIGPGDEVLVPDLTFTATANAVRLAGADVVLVDVEPVRFGIDPDGVEAAIGPRTRAHRHRRRQRPRRRLWTAGADLPRQGPRLDLRRRRRTGLAPRRTRDRHVRARELLLVLGQQDDHRRTGRHHHHRQRCAARPPARAQGPGPASTAAPAATTCIR